MDYPRVNESCYEMVGKLLNYFDSYEEEHDPMYVGGGRVWLVW